MPPKPRKATPRKASAKPGQPPTGADFSALVKKVNEVAAKVGLSPLNATITGKIPAWKRWVGGENEYDVKGLRDVVQTNAGFTDQIKNDVDSHGQAILEMRQEIRELQEAAPSTSFP